MRLTLKNIIDKYSLTVDEAADVLFPHAKYKRRCINRVLQGKQSISVDQLYELADYIGINITNFFN